jgi:hypothetical protein
MSKVTKYKGMSKKSFEALLFNINANQVLGYRKTVEDFENPSFIHLYYDRKDRHLGTWHKGSCWTFDSVTDDLMLKENRKI